MSHTHHYIGTREECETQARASCIDWLGGEERYQKLCSDLREELARLGTTRSAGYKMLRMYIPFAGIAGYWPIRAMARDILRPLPPCSEEHGPHNVCAKCAILPDDDQLRQDCTFEEDIPDYAWSTLK